MWNTAKGAAAVLEAWHIVVWCINDIYPVLYIKNIKILDMLLSFKLKPSFQN